MRHDMVVIGLGGFGREVLDVIDAINADVGRADRLNVVGILDDAAPAPSALELYDLDYLGATAELERLPESVGYVIGIGSPRTRQAIDEVGQRSHLQSPVLRHPSATVGRGVSFGPGSVVCSHVSISNTIRFGRHVHLNPNCTVGHDALLEDYVSVSPMVAISGNVHVQRGVFLGTGCSINQGLTIEEWAVVGAGAAAVRDVESGSTVVGVPAKARTRS
jgi:sugar O-acyltransferase (sialic acid O-acetyltransferase NeuD family)